MKVTEVIHCKLEELSKTVSFYLAEAMSEYDDPDNIVFAPILERLTFKCSEKGVIIRIGSFRIICNDPLLEKDYVTKIIREATWKTNSDIMGLFGHLSIVSGIDEIPPKPNGKWWELEVKIAYL